MNGGYYRHLQPNGPALINLLEMPMEILEHILMHLNSDKHLLAAPHVCKSFAAAAETAFARKYSNKCYRISLARWLFEKHRQSISSFHQIMLAKYGAKIRNITIDGDDERLLALAEQKCCNLRVLKLIAVPKMLMVKDVKKLLLIRIRNVDRETFAELINNNQQLEFLNIKGTDVDLIDILDGRLNELKTLKYHQTASKHHCLFSRFTENQIEFPRNIGNRSAQYR